MWFLSLLLAVGSSRPSVLTTVRAASATTATTSYKTLQVHVIHRHGDRTPITPLQNFDYWRQQLVPESTLTRVARNTNIIRDKPFVHSASGGNHADSPFGKLTQLGLLQMIQVGTTLRQALLQEEEEEDEKSKGGDSLFYTPLFRRNSSRHNNNGSENDDEQQRSSLPLLHPSRVRIYSTDFQRTIQSVQGLLVGLFPDGGDDYDENDPSNHVNMMDIDVRHTEWMIPDPQPRPTKEQHELEIALSQHRPHMIQREQTMAPLAHKATKALYPLLDLSKGARQVSFGVDNAAAAAPDSDNDKRRMMMMIKNENDCDDNNEPVHVEEDSIEEQPLGWNQLAEITKCLQVRNLLPATGLTLEDQQAISDHAAWRWMETLSHPRLAYLAMHQLVQFQVQSMLSVLAYDTKQHQQKQSLMPPPPPPPPPPLTIWSAHDSTLVGLFCAYRLERPPVWPEYASYLVLELVQVTTNKKNTVQPPQDDDDENKDNSFLAVRFSLNGQRLRSDWSKDDLVPSKDGDDDDNEEPAALSSWDDLIPLNVLAERTQTIGATPLSYDANTGKIMLS